MEMGRRQSVERERNGAGRTAGFFRPRGASGLTMVEMLVAVSISLAFLAAVVTAFIQITRASEIAERNTRATNNARAALEIIAIDISKANIFTDDAENSMLGTNNALAFGDGVDNDGDGDIDEEQNDGLDTDGDWDDDVANDVHVAIGSEFERPLLQDVADSSDRKVDEDVVFNLDELTFVRTAQFLGIFERVTYRVTTFDGLENTLVRIVERDFRIEGGVEISDSVTSDPLAFDVFSVNFLYWDANRLQGGSPGPDWPPYWVEEWNEDEVNGGEPGLELPIAVKATISVNAGKQAIGNLAVDDPKRVMTLTTTVNIEQMLDDPRYDQVRGQF